MINIKLTIGDVTLLSVTLWESADDKLNRIVEEVNALPEAVSVAGDLQATYEDTRNETGFHANIVSTGITPYEEEEYDDDGRARGSLRSKTMGRH